MSFLKQWGQRLREKAWLLHAIRRHVAVIEFTPQGQILTANAPFLEVMGYELEQIVGQHHALFCEPELVRSSGYRRFWAQLAAGRSQRGTFARRDAQGRVVWLEATYFPVATRSGTVSKVVKIAADVTHEVQQRLRQEAVFAAIDRSMAVIEFTPDGVVLAANDNFLATMGYARDAIVGQHHRLFCDEAFYREHPRFWQELAAGDFKSGKFGRIAADGSQVWLEATYNPVLDEAGQVVKVIKFATDITARVLQAEQVQQAAEVAHLTASQTASIIDRGREAIVVSANTSQRIAHQLAEADATLDKLRDQARSIERIVATIRSVADQTKLLALNAAIEAARAGSHGRSFAVVADEVRQLAARTSGATGEIDAVVRQNLAVMAEVSDVIQELSQAAQQGTSEVSTVEGIMHEIQLGANHVLSAVQRLH